MNKALFFAVLAAGAATVAHADYRVEINAIDVKGVGAPLGEIVASAAPGGGVLFTPKLKGLPPGPHGFHVHEFANCAAAARDGKMTAGALAGGHWDPEKAGKHGSPEGGGHKGDLPPLQVAGDGTAAKAVRAPRLKLEDLANKSLVIHAGGDNHSDTPKPLGGGGDRIACGVIQPERKGGR